MLDICPECSGVRIPCEHCGNSGWGGETQENILNISNEIRDVLNKSIVGKVSGEVQTESIRNVLQDIYKINYGIEASVTVDPIDPNEFHITSKVVSKNIIFNMET